MGYGVEKGTKAVQGVSVDVSVLFRARNSGSASSPNNTSEEHTTSLLHSISIAIASQTIPPADMPALLDLSPELWEHVATHASLPALESFSCTSKGMRDVAAS